MKRSFVIIALLILTTNLFANDFSSEISRINAAGFPKIGVFLKVFNKQPEELKNDNFVISEDSSPIQSFSLEFSRPKHFMTLVIDRSSSIEPAMSQVKQAATSFIQSMISETSIAIVSFGSDVDFSHKFSQDLQSLTDAIKKIKPWGGTAMYDAIYTACDDIQNSAGRNDLKTVVCLTDGHDSTPNGKKPLSIKTPEEVCRFATDKGIRIITVGLGNDIDVEILKNFAQSTGGWYLQTTSPESLAKLYEALSRRMKLEKYYRLTYTTPKPEADGSRRNVEIISRLKGSESQGKGFYNAPSKAVAASKSHTGSSDKNKSKFSVTEVFSSLHIDGPDEVFLTSPVIPPPASPVHGPNAATFLGCSKDACQEIIDKARIRMGEEHKANYEEQQKYFNNYLQALDRMQKANNEWAAKPDLKEFEKPRIEYRNTYLQMRREEIGYYSQKSYEEYLVDFKTSMDELDYYQKVQVMGEPEDDSFFHSNSASQTAALNLIDSKYDEILKKHDEKESQHFHSTLDSRGANVEFETRTETRELDIPEPDDVSEEPEPEQPDEEPAGDTDYEYSPPEIESVDPSDYMPDID